MQPNKKHHHHSVNKDGKEGHTQAQGQETHQAAGLAAATAAAQSAARAAQEQLAQGQAAPEQAPEHIDQDADILDIPAEDVEVIEGEEPAKAAPAAGGAPQSEIEALRMELEKVKAEGAKNKDLMMRTIAEAQNARRRAEEDVQKERKFGLERFVKALIPVVDSLDMALTLTDRNNPAVKPTIDGVESTLNLFLKELGSFGVERIDPVGQAFDPNFHQAISMAPSSGVAANHVINVMQKGFLLNGRVVRPAMVVVSKGQEQAQNAYGGQGADGGQGSAGDSASEGGNIDIKA